MIRKRGMRILLSLADGVSRVRSRAVASSGRGTAWFSLLPAVRTHGGGRIKRNSATRAQLQATTPVPERRKAGWRTPRYVIDHVNALKHASRIHLKKCNGRPSRMRMRRIALNEFGLRVSAFWVSIY